MTRLAMLIYSIASTILASVAVVAGLVSGLSSAGALLGLAGAGFLAAIPATWVVVRKITG